MNKEIESIAVLVWCLMCARFMLRDLMVLPLILLVQGHFLLPGNRLGEIMKFVHCHSFNELFEPRPICLAALCFLPRRRGLSGSQVTSLTSAGSPILQVKHPFCFSLFLPTQLAM